MFHSQTLYGSKNYRQKFMKQRSVLENVLRLLGSQFTVLTGGMERQTPKLSSSQLLSHHVFG